MTTPSPAVLDSITQFLKLTPLREDPRHAKWIRDEFDLLEAISITRDCYHDTQRMIGKPMYVGDKDFDFTEDVKRAVEENLLNCRDPKEQMVHRKRNITMYHLVIEPIIDQLSKLQLPDVLATVDGYFDAVGTAVLTNPVDAHFDDAIVAREMINAKVRALDVARKQQKLDRRTKKKQPTILDLLENDDSDD